MSICVLYYKCKFKYINYSLWLSLSLYIYMCYTHIMYPEYSWRITLPNILINPCEVAGLRSRRRCRGSTGESGDQHGPAESAAGVLEAKGAANSREVMGKWLKTHDTRDTRLHDATRNWMTLHDVTQHCMALHDITWHYMTWHDTTLHGITWRATTLHMTLHSMIARDILRYYMAYCTTYVNPYYM